MIGRSISPVAALALAVAGIFTVGSSSAVGVVNFSDDFTINTSGNYTVLEAVPGRDGAQFVYDYSAVGIPEAPNSVAGGRTGLRLFANNPFAGTTAQTGAVQVVPNNLAADLAAADSYTVTYDLWMNFNGPAPAGGTGSTEAFMVGAGFNGSTPIKIGTLDGSYFTITGEGGSGTDIRSFTDGGFNEAGVNQGGGDSGDAYYAGIFPGGVNLDTFNQGGNQTGVTNPGQMGFQWHEIQLDVDNIADTVSFYVDGLLIARDTTTPDIDGTVFVGYGDYFASESDAPQFSFGLVDNLSIVSSPIPEPTGLALLGLGAMALRRRRAS